MHPDAGVGSSLVENTFLNQTRNGLHHRQLRAATAIRRIIFSFSRSDPAGFPLSTLKGRNNENNTEHSREQNKRYRDFINPKT
jgi:hypothetical protein